MKKNLKSNSILELDHFLLENIAMFTSCGGKEVQINTLVGLEVFLLEKKDGCVVG